jgi:hypothetical protein
MSKCVKNSGRKLFLDCKWNCWKGLSGGKRSFTTLVLVGKNGDFLTWRMFQEENVELIWTQHVDLGLGPARNKSLQRALDAGLRSVGIPKARRRQ